MVAKPTEGHLPTWLADLLRAMCLNQYSESAAQPGLAVETIASLNVPVPPVAEQQTMVSFLHREAMKTESLASKTRVAIDRLKEYRTALISAAVTGKIDVREEKA